MTIQLNGERLDVLPGQSETLYDIIKKNGFHLNAPCGGNGRCGKCRVTIANAAAPTATDRALIAGEDIASGVRLACVTLPFEGMDVRFEQAGERPARIMTEGRSVQYAFAPPVRRAAFTMAAPTLGDQSDDLCRLARALGTPALSLSRGMLSRLPGALRSGSWQGSAALMGDRLLGLDPGAVLGMAVDIGTTTLAGYLVNLETGEEMAVASALNPQKAFGDDVITRADHARGGGLAALQRAVSAEIDALAGALCKMTAASREDVYHVTVAGNTVMMHLFAGITPEHIAASPFIPAFTAAMEYGAAELGLRLNAEAVATLLPCVAGYIGADTVAGILSSGMAGSPEAQLLIDIGTNGEIALAAGGKLWACSTAAGPAFEGAHISCGMGGVAGAVNKATLNGELRFTTIGDAPPRGICGSGLLDLVAGLLDCGAVDDTGRIDADGAPGWLRVEGDAVVVDDASGIRLTGRDIREVQLAKGAIAAGLEVLAAEAGVRLDDISRVYLAGGFGSYMDKRSAGRVGLIPPALTDRTVAIGNSSGAGARAALLSAEAMGEAARIARSVTYVELSARKDFQDAFMDKMMFS